MTKTKIILVVCFLVTFAAGSFVGWSVSRPDHPRGGPSWLTAELNLTPEQRDQMHAIWSEAMGATMKQRGEQGKALRQERDQAVIALLSDEQKTRYDVIYQDYLRKEGELSDQRKQAFDEAVKRTMLILTPEQAARYEDLMKKQPERGFGPPRGGHWGRPPGPPPDAPPDAPPGPPPE